MRVIHLASNKVWAGGERYIAELCRRMRRELLDVRVVCRARSVARRLDSDAIPTAVAPLRGFVDLVTPFMMLRWIGPQETVIHVHNFKDAFTAIVARMLSPHRGRCRVVVTRHLVKAASNSALYRFIYRRIDHFIFVSALAQRQFMSSGVRIEPGRASVIMNSLPEPSDEGRACDDLRAQHHIDRRKCLLTYLGRLHEEKGIEVLLMALREVDPARYHLLIVGSGTEEYSARLKSLALRYAIAENVTFVGHVEHPMAVIRQSDIGVLPSIAPEAFGLSNLEFMQAGKPQVCSNNGAQVEFLEDQTTALLTPPNDAVCLAEAINRLIASPELRLMMGSEARLVQQRSYTYDRFYDQVSEVYASCGASH